MKESIKKIVYSIVVTAIAIMGVVLYIFLDYNNSIKNDSNDGIGINSRKIEVNILADTIICEEEIDFSLLNQDEIFYQFFNKKDEVYLSNVCVEQINNHIEPYSTNLHMSLSNGAIYLSEFDTKDYVSHDNKIKIKLSYEIDKDYIMRYTDTDVLPIFISWEKINYINALEVNITSNNRISNLTTDNSISKFKVSQNKYKYNILAGRLTRNGNINILFKINSKTNNVINTEYVNEKAVLEKNEKLEKQNIKTRQDAFDKEYYSYVLENMPLLTIIAIISILLLITTKVINRKQKIKTYKRDLTGLVPPVIAEAVVDGKIGLKEMIMTTIVDLNVRGNIKIINNEILELVTTDNLEDYEKNIVELLFTRQEIKLNDINNVFLESNVETVQFAEKIDKIKKAILDKIYSMNLFSIELTMANRVIKIISTAMALNCPIIILKEVPIVLAILINIVYIRLYIKSIKEKRPTKANILKKQNTKGKGRVRSNLGVVIILYVFLVASYKIAIFYPIIFLSILMVIVINLCTGHSCSRAVLTKKGKEEQAKLLALQNYMKEYSLLKNRDLVSAYIWDAYLAYATAFGIPNKVTNQIYEKWFNLNLNLQIIERIL